ncbi:hypothetical protein TRFO_01383 [Tritrichomonas foetus]|uniref:Uncharacterized protein n=1 Tax=Tritrichomonas foetus TaxID=1144522 RepID=A0A1J4KC03_9EUKA|nr:hypothetical protein TRFO_01383 [Tritrichomonas foetus]|eukprot:OHT07220.1 hypothetical protein TRFO_01383 [Tritrichomonas foetus]
MTCDLIFFKILKCDLKFQTKISFLVMLRNFDAEINPDYIEDIAINFTNIQEIPHEILFQVLHHPKCNFPPHSVFIDQVIEVLSEDNDKKYLPLLSFIDCSVASLEQLRHLSEYDIYNFFPDISKYRQIREAEEDIEMRSSHINYIKQKIALNSVEPYFKSNHLRNLTLQVNRLQTQNSIAQGNVNQLNSKHEASQKHFNIRKKEREELIKSEKMSSTLDNDTLINDLQNQTKQCEKIESDALKGLNEAQKKAKLDEENLEKIQLIVKLKSDYKAAMEQQDQLRNEDNELKEKFKELQSRMGEIIGEEEELPENENISTLNEGAFQRYIDRLCQKAQDLLNSKPQKNVATNPYYRARFIVNEYEKGRPLNDDENEVLEKIK